MELSDLDRQLLEHLAADGRLSARELARRTGASAPTVLRHVRSLESLNLITGWGAHIDPLQMGQHLSHLDGQCPTPEAAAELVEELAERPSIESCAALPGGRVVARIQTADAPGMKREIAAVTSLSSWTNVACTPILRTRRGRARLHLPHGHEVDLDCAWCHAAVHGPAVIVRSRNRELPACCETCATALRERLIRLEQLARDGHATPPHGGSDAHDC